MAVWIGVAGLVAASPVSTLAGESPAVVLAAGDIADCHDPWSEDLLELMGIRPEDNPTASWTDEALVLLGLAEAPAPGAAKTAALLEGLPGEILAAGDLAYGAGTAAEFTGCYGPTWGRFKDRTRPVPGNHEYLSEAAAPYYDYWGRRAGEAGRGYYSFDVGPWHVVALNSSIDVGPGSAQARWLRDDLRATDARCVLAFAHHPRFSSGYHGNQSRMATLYRLLYEHGASVMVAGHDHNYERLAPLGPDGELDRARGIQGFVVGTGGAELRGVGRRHAHSQVFSAQAWGVLKLELYPDRYAWQFLPVEGGSSLRDSGGVACVPRSAKD